MLKRCLCFTGIIGMFIMASCAGPSRLAMDYGTSYQLAKFNQILNPQAEKNLEPVTGFDGVAAKVTMEKYWKDFEKAQAQPGYIFNLGSGSVRR